MKRTNILTLMKQNAHLYSSYEADLLESFKDVNIITSTRLNNRLDLLFDQYPELAIELVSYTPKLTHASHRARIMLIVEGYEDVPTCQCGKATSFSVRTGRWNRYCSPRCAAKDPAVQQRISQTNKERRGVTRPLQIAAIGNRVRSALETSLKDRSEVLSSD